MHDPWPRFLELIRDRLRRVENDHPLAAELARLIVEERPLREILDLASACASGGREATTQQ
jgi:hypothetical protein